MSPNWNTTESGKMREDEFTTSYGERSRGNGGDSGSAGWDGKSCADFHQLPGRGIRDVESLTLLNGLARQEAADEPDEDE